MSAPQRLPMEIILHIIDSVADGPGMIYSPADDVTKTLLSFTLVCRGTHAAASNNLRRHCMYIEDEKRLADCVGHLKATKHLVPEYNAGNIDNAKFASPGARLWPITSLYLAPFFDDIDHQQTLSHVSELCALIGSSLTRLILDIPFWYFSQSWNCESRSFRIQDLCQTTVSSIFKALSVLTEVTDVVWMRDCLLFEPFSRSLSALRIRIDDGPFAWKFWPNLRRLALHNVAVNGFFWHGVRKAELDTLILARPFWTDEGCQKTAFLRTIPADLDRPETGPTTLKSPRRINIVVAARRLTFVREKLLVGALHWPLIDPDNLIKFSLRHYPVSGDDSEGFGSSETSCAYLRTAALRDEIWTWKGEMVGESGDETVV